jgi:ABC-type Fe3+ transport system substrate-binding protein
VPFRLLLALQTILGIGLGVLTLALRFRVGARRQRPLLVAWVLMALMAAAPIVVWREPNPGAERRVRIVSVLDEETSRALASEFTRQTGIACDVDALAGGAQSTVEWILRGRLQPDIFLGGTVEIHEELARAGQLEHFALPPGGGRVDRYDDPRGNWTPLYLGYLAIVHRPLPELQAHPPDWLTLIHPRWKGRVSLPAPDQSGGGLVFLATQVMRFGPDTTRAWDYLRLLRDNSARYEPRSEIPITRVASGTMDLAVAWAHDVVRRVERERLPVELRIPTPTGLEVGGVSILKGARDLDGCRALVRFLVGREAGEIQVNVGRRVPLRTDVEPPTYLAQSALSAEATAYYDRDRFLAERQEWLGRWRELQAAANGTARLPDVEPGRPASPVPATGAGR